MRILTGLSPLVQGFVAQDERELERVMTQAKEAHDRGDKEFVFTCFGGRHRSVAVAEIFAKYLRAKGVKVVTEHVTLRDLGVVAA